MKGIADFRPKGGGNKPGRKYPSLPRLLFIIPLLLVLTVGCGTLTPNKAILGVGEWWVASNERLKAELSDSLATGNAERYNFLIEKVAPYMDIAKYGIIGWNGLKDKKDKQIAYATKGLLRHGAQFDYDATKLIAAIKAEDYTTVRRELLRLKNLIIAKWVLPKE